MPLVSCHLFAALTCIARLRHCSCGTVTGLHTSGPSQLYCRCQPGHIWLGSSTLPLPGHIFGTWTRGGGPRWLQRAPALPVAARADSGANSGPSHWSLYRCALLRPPLFTPVDSAEQTCMLAYHASPVPGNQAAYGGRRLGSRCDGRARRHDLCWRRSSARRYSDSHSRRTQAAKWKVILSACVCAALWQRESPDHSSMIWPWRVHIELS